MDTYSINPASIIDEAVDLSMRLAGTDFPVSIFPTKIQRIISEVHECHNYPTDYIASAILTAIAVGIGNTHLAQIKQGWVESPILYMALIGRPGANKSHPLSFAMKPFLDYDYQQNQVFEKAFDYSGFHLLDGLQDIIPVFRVYVFVYTDDFREGRRCFFSQIIIPLRDPIAGTCPDVESTISDFADHRERTFEFCQLAIYLCDFGIVDID